MVPCPACGDLHQPIPEACLYQGRPRASEPERGVRHGEREECDDVRDRIVHRSNVTPGVAPPDGHCMFHTVCQLLKPLYPTRPVAMWGAGFDGGEMDAVMALRAELADFVKTNLNTSLCPGGHSVTQAILADGQCGSVDTYLQRLRSGVFMQDGCEEWQSGLASNL